MNVLGIVVGIGFSISAFAQEGRHVANLIQIKKPDLKTVTLQGSAITPVVYTPRAGLKFGTIIETPPAPAGTVPTATINAGNTNPQPAAPAKPAASSSNNEAKPAAANAAAAKQPPANNQVNQEQEEEDDERINNQLAQALANEREQNRSILNQIDKLEQQIENKDADAAAAEKKRVKDQAGKDAVAATDKIKLGLALRATDKARGDALIAEGRAALLKLNSDPNADVQAASVTAIQEFLKDKENATAFGKFLEETKPKERKEPEKSLPPVITA